MKSYECNKLEEANSTDFFLHSDAAISAFSRFLPTLLLSSSSWQLRSIVPFTSMQASSLCPIQLALPRLKFMNFRGDSFRYQREFQDTV